MYQMKLSRSAQHEPVRGFWCRVCETCYKSREGYNDHKGMCNGPFRFENFGSLLQGLNEITPKVSLKYGKKMWTRPFSKSRA